MAHTCHARGCTAEVPPELLMCAHHWKMVPKDIQTMVWRHYRPGQCDDKRPSPEWMRAAQMAIDAVRVGERKRVFR
jgi:hypothetical protein